MGLFDFLRFAPKGRIGDIEIAATLEEIYTDTLQVTEHPVEVGAAITDHAYMRPKEVVIKCGWTNSTLDELLSAVGELFGDESSVSDYVTSVYENLRVLQSSREPFDIVTTKRQYSNMVMVSLQVTTDQQTSNVLMVTATCRQIFIVETQATTIPPQEAQADPASTAATQNAGVKQTQPAAPMMGGAVAPGAM